MTSLGTQAVVLEAEVSADNWLAALRAARDQLRDPGGVPPGASCVVAESGEVTILDAANRRRYMLTPAAALPQPEPPRRPPPRPSRAPEPAPAESPAEIAARAAAAVENQPVPVVERGPSPAELEARAAAARENQAERAPSPAELEARAAAALENQAEEAPSARHAQTLAYSAQRADALRREYESSRARSLPPEGDRPSRSNLRALPPVNRAASSMPPAPKLERSVPASRPPSADGPVSLVPAFARDVEPTPRSPITYRERAFLVTPANELGNLEGLLQAELLKLREELAGAPRGQLIHLAVFDKPLRDAPNAPPIATLEWSDWRGNAVFVGQAEHAPSRALVEPPVGDIPAPGSHVAPIPRALRPSEATAPTEPPPSELSRPRPSTTPPKAGGKSPWDKLRAAAAGEPPEPARAPVAPAVPPAAIAPPPAPAPAAPPVAAPSEAPVAAPNEAPAASEPVLPWMTAPAPQSAGPIAVPPAFQTGGHKALRDDTGEVDNRLAQAFEALPDLYFLPTPVAGLEFATQLLSRLVPCEAISVCLYDINTDEFRFVAVGGPGANERRASAVPSQAGLFGAAKWTVEDAMIVANVASDARYQPAIDGRGELEMLNLAYVPIRFSTALHGMIQLINRGGDQGFTKSDIAVLHYVANQLGEFLATRRSLVG